MIGRSTSVALALVLLAWAAVGGDAAADQFTCVLASNCPGGTRCDSATGKCCNRDAAGVRRCCKPERVCGSHCCFRPRICIGGQCPEHSSLPSRLACCRWHFKTSLRKPPRAPTPSTATTNLIPNPNPPTNPPALGSAGQQGLSARVLRKGGRLA
ncbi:hypothetical protein Rsub_00810 [Raphidocelis subcapitata]|uniref:Granulins domain-containing protein n=1 Tax=Raphidocelis subcapitata TaxID=307507 RepID=A0A2V0NL44_9CHLO|nr:hypothetical protein Rsub_00810 [Raphidocelis subcapitata]|eukprot:GBF88098.1 hypothetical protein Rsub_00810 [Raphidocelis subcapitata]